MQDTKTALNPKLGLMLGVLGVSMSSIFVRVAEAPSLVMAAWRLLWALILLTPLVLWKHREELRVVTPKDILFCGVSGILLALHFASWFEAIARTTITEATVLCSTEVVFAALGYRVLLKGKIPPLGLVCIGAALGGTVLVAWGSGGLEGSDMLGDILALAAAVFVAGYTLIGRIQRGHLSTSIYTWLTYMACAATLLCMMLATGTPLVGWGAQSVFIGFLLGAVCTLLGHSVFSWCLKYLDPAYVAATKLCEPVFASAVAIVLFGEIPGSWQLAGSIVLITSLLIYTLKVQKT